MPSKKKWHPKDYPILLLKVVAVSIHLQQMGFQPAKNNLRVNFTRWSGTIWFEHQGRVAEFHAGVPDRDESKLIGLLDRCFEGWNGLTQPEREEYWDYIPYEIMKPLVQTELENKGFLLPQASGTLIPVT